MISIRWRALASRKSAPLLVLNLDFGPSGAKSLMFRPSSHVLVVFDGGFVLFVWPLLQRDMVIDVFQAQVSCFAAIHPVAPSSEFAKVSKSRLPAEFNLLSQFEKHMRDCPEHDSTVVLKG